MNKKIGILGGIGPEASAEIYTRLIDRFQKTMDPRDNTSYPHVVIDSAPLPDLIVGASEAVLGQYVKALKDLEKTNVKMIGIACNTAHVFLKYFQDRIKTPIIDLPELLKKKLTDSRFKKITILASPTGYDNKLYQFVGFEYFNPNDQEIIQLGNAITKYNLGKNKQSQTEIVREIALNYSKKSEVIIAACTEVAAMLANASLAVIDPMDILIDEIIRCGE